MSSRFVWVLGLELAVVLSFAACAGAPPRSPIMPEEEEAPPPPAVRSGPVPSPWRGMEDIPCSAGSQAFLPALESRVLHRIRPPIGVVPISVAGGRAVAQGLQVKVVLEIDRRGTIRRSAIMTSSGLFELDRAVQNAIDEAGCMPAPPSALMDARAATFKISLGYLFRRG